ncbi:hypothetical protein E4U55_001045 [Claviceps digitariae]|nr:hypothetical protein E4U55_001045 [Claviceps digitariae]
MDFNSRFGSRIAQCELSLEYNWKHEALGAAALNMAADMMAFCEVHGTIQRVNKNDRLAVYGDSDASAAKNERGMSFAKNAYRMRIWQTEDSPFASTDAAK